MCQSAACGALPNMVVVLLWCGHPAWHCLCEVCWLWWVHVASRCWVLSLLRAINLPFWWMAAVMCCCHGCEVWAFGLLDGPARGHILCGVHNCIMGPVCTLSVTVHGGGGSCCPASIHCRHAHARHGLSCFLLAFFVCAVLLRAVLEAVLPARA